jgi:hypothetical protein
MKLKARNGRLLELSHFFKNDNYIEFNIDLFDWGLGFDFRIGDSRMFFELDFLVFHFTIWF